MNRKLRWASLGLLLLAMPGLGQNPGGARITVTPRLEPIAETKLLMEGLANPNFRGLERKLTAKPADDQTWTFARGQALLIAESANLLMLRPPKNQGQTAWFERAMELRQQASALAQVLGKKDYERSRAGLQLVANSCNRCHQTFRVPIDIVPFQQAEPAPRKVEQPAAGRRPNDRALRLLDASPYNCLNQCPGQANKPLTMKLASTLQPSRG